MFMSYGQTVPLVKRLSGKEVMGPAEFFAAGAAAQIIGAFIESPIDFFKSQMFVNLSNFTWSQLHMFSHSNANKICTDKSK